jgi:hypothetical protein
LAKVLPLEDFKAQGVVVKTILSVMTCIKVALLKRALQIRRWRTIKVGERNFKTFRFGFVWFR